MKPITAYFDLRPGDAIEVRERQIYLGLKEIETDGSAVLDVRCAYRKGAVPLAEGRFLHLDKIVSVFSFGKRKRGKRIHVRMDVKANRPLQIEKTKAIEEDEGLHAGMITAGELAERWRIASDTIIRWTTEGKLPHPVRIGNDLLFSLEEVLDLEDWNTEERQESRRPKR